MKDQSVTYIIKVYFPYLDPHIQIREFTGSERFLNLWEKRVIGKTGILLKKVVRYEK